MHHSENNATANAQAREARARAFHLSGLRGGVASGKLALSLVG
ncbi:MAG: hypothetical protein ACI8QF_003576, partial [Limisphaerales bacterium]